MTKLYFIKEALFELLGNRVDFLKEKFIKDYVESRIEDSLKAYPELDKSILSKSLSEEAIRLFTLLEQADPTKNKQYLQWIIKQYKEEMASGGGGYRFFEDLPKLTTRLEIFHDLGVHKKLQGKDKDINQYVIDMPSDEEEADKLRRKGITGLKELTEPYMKSESDLTQDEQKIIEEQAEKIWDGKEWTVYVPKTELSACVLGKDTDWCTTYGYEGGRYPTRTGNMFEHYNSQGNLYILVNKKNGEKYQFHFPSDQFMDSSDSAVSLSEFIDDNPEIGKAFESRLPKLKEESVETLNARIRSDQIGNWVDDEMYNAKQSYSFELQDVIYDVYNKYAEQNHLIPTELKSLLDARGVTETLLGLDIEPDEVDYTPIHKFVSTLKTKVRKTDSFSTLVDLLEEAPSSNSEYWYESPLFEEVNGAVFKACRRPMERAVVKEFNKLIRENRQFLQREQEGQMNLFAIKAVLKKLLS